MPENDEASEDSIPVARKTNGTKLRTIQQWYPVNSVKRTFWCRVSYTTIILYGKSLRSACKIILIVRFNTCKLENRSVRGMPRCFLKQNLWLWCSEPTTKLFHDLEQEHISQAQSEYEHFFASQSWNRYLWSIFGRQKHDTHPQVIMTTKMIGSPELAPNTNSSITYIRSFQRFPSLNLFHLYQLFHSTSS